MRFVSYMRRSAKILILIKELRDHRKNILWASRLWVGRRKEPILGYVPKNDEKKEFMHLRVKPYRHQKQDDRFFLTSDTIDILCQVHSNFYVNKIMFKIL